MGNEKMEPKGLEFNNHFKKHRLMKDYLWIASFMIKNTA